MNDTVYINTTVLSQVVTDLTNVITELENINTQNIAPAINLSKSAFSVAGLNTDDIAVTYSNLFSQLVTRLGNLKDTLNNKVIPGYNDTANLFANQFGTEFATQFGSFLEKMKVSNE